MGGLFVKCWRGLFEAWRLSWRVRSLISAVVAAAVTPPDPFSMLMVWVPLCVLSEIVALFVRSSYSKARP
jgi:Sec-independent protein secretion pathway component TatC